MWILPILGLSLGLAYYFFIGMEEPASSLQNNPWFTSLYGIFCGVVVGLIIKDLTDTDRERSIV